MEEGGANVVASGAGGVLDSSGNGNNGTALNSPVYRANTAVSSIPQTGAADNRSMQFSGTGQQRVYINDGPQFAITGSLTIEAYFNVAAIPNAAGSILFRGDDRTGFDPYFLNVETGLIRFGVNDASNTQTLVTAPLPGLNQWIFAAGVLDTTAHTMSLYVNGTLVNTISTTTTPLGPLDSTQEPGVAIGGHPSTFFGDFMSFDGMIDEVRLSNTALSPSQFLNAVPEPAAGGLLGCVVFGFLARRRRA
jgi:MSHA biogenesis protein MshQ